MIMTPIIIRPIMVITCTSHEHHLRVLLAFADLDRTKPELHFTEHSSTSEIDGPLFEI